MPFWNRTDETPSQEGSPMSTTKRDEPTPTTSGAGDLLLGAGAEFEGKLTFAGTVRIDAKFKGTIVTNDVLVVGERARIDADITCGTVIIHGEVNGNIRARNGVELHAPAKVRGDVETPSLSLERGVVFQGQTTMAADKAASASAQGQVATRMSGGATRNVDARPAAAPQSREP